MSGQWQGSNRKERLPRDWKTRRAKVLERDPICYVCHTRASQHVDHVVRGDNHAYENLKGICAWCHGKKSSAEGNAAKRPLPSRARPSEDHPGG
jgi:5-methylcytosine-specific restriction enzyme A